MTVTVDNLDLDAVLSVISEIREKCEKSLLLDRVSGGNRGRFQMSEQILYLFSTAHVRSALERLRCPVLSNTLTEGS